MDRTKYGILTPDGSMSDQECLDYCHEINWDIGNNKTNLIRLLFLCKNAYMYYVVETDGVGKVYLLNR